MVTENSLRTGADDRSYRPASLWNAVPHVPKLLCALLLALSLASAATEGIGLMLLVPMLSVLGGAADETGAIGTWFAAVGVEPTFRGLLGVFVLLVVARATINLVRSITAQLFEARLVDGLRMRLLDGLLNCDWRTLSQMRQSDNASLLITALDRVSSGVAQMIAVMVTLLTLGGIGVAALAISPLVALLALASGVVVMLAFRPLRQSSARLGTRLNESYETIHGETGEVLGALRVIKSMGAEPEIVKLLHQRFNSMRAAELAFVRASGLGQAALQIGGALVLALIVWVAVSQGDAQLATVLAMTALFARALPLLGILQTAMQNWHYARPALEATLTLIATTGAARETDEADVQRPPHAARSITLRGITVRYAGRRLAALHSVDMELPVHTLTVLAGPSGSGKSTLADVAGGLLQPDEGELLIDNEPLRLGTLRAWRRSVAYVQQDPVLFTGTIRNNLQWCVPLTDEARLNTALRLASGEFVFDLPSGLDTWVGEGGRQLSGGEKQRIVLARSLLREAQLLILDESGSSLDRANVEAIVAAVSRIRATTTILVIDHHGTFEPIADRIVRIDRGRLV